MFSFLLSVSDEGLPTSSPGFAFNSKVFSLLFKLLKVFCATSIISGPFTIFSLSLSLWKYCKTTPLNNSLDFLHNLVILKFL
ncbi:MAG: hypothetical protein EHV01_005695 [Spiroplasma sp. hy2]|uniref:hypothetical protein n=1 Tax=Spiroplasma sp. hy2 TaxID=2490850 RepID=UPI003B4990AB